MSAPQPRKVLHLPKVRMLSRGGRLAPNIRITDVKSIRPPAPEIAKKQEEDKIRAQLQKEIVSRSRTCSYPGYECWAPVVAGRKFCAAHILRDSTAPYVQCAHTFGNGERCANTAGMQDREHRLCFEHARQALLSRQRSAAPPPPVTSTETLLNQLHHYVKPERPRTTSCASSVSVVSDPAEPELVSPIAVDPFKQMDATAINTAYSQSILECASGSESEGESITLGPEGNCRHTQHSSDVEEAPTESSPLWRAGVFTAEEAISETKTCLRSLQSAYIRQMGRLKVLLQTARLQYLRQLRQEKEAYCSINSQARSGPLSVRERRQLRKLKAYAAYHRKHGVDAVLARKLHHKRAKANESQSSRAPASTARCVFSEGGVRCGSAAVPATRHCARHVLHDRHQVLFKACADLRGLSACREPVTLLPMPSSTCRYHTDPPTYQVFTLKKDDTDSGSEIDSSLTEDADPLDQSLDPLDPTLESLDPTLGSLNPIGSLDPTIGSLDPTIESLDPTIESLEPGTGDSYT